VGEIETSWIAVVPHLADAYPRFKKWQGRVSLGVEDQPSALE